MKPDEAQSDFRLGEVALMKCQQLRSLPPPPHLGCDAEDKADQRSAVFASVHSSEITVTVLS